MSDSANPYCPRYEDLYASEYFSPVDFHGPLATFKGPLVVTITAHQSREVFCKNAGKKTRMILTVAGQKKLACLNKTSFKALCFAWGTDFNSWIGRQISIDGGEVNGKAATLCKPIKGNGGAGRDRQESPAKSLDQKSAESSAPTTLAPPIDSNSHLASAESTHGQAREVLREMGDELETANIVFIKASKVGDRFSLLDGNGEHWVASPDVMQALSKMKGSGRVIGVSHFGRHIETVFEVPK